ncbi:hypothetical protein BD309DRAFT_1064203 [Dichomitus squalens]|uniref:Uncharacterized protein n=1 Tax=Dichomitus squalens TaxID=114155 RepID=A0A4Q9PTA5_9APHY|nr:hypothetical protein BD311DRAFT_840347 [Dichomitus squalens]TBU37303.1 hypothetical protein BD309DRAFT_1064203 [Dichomitus squalens]TBU57640.1 hypothetical protein BD310DRAFT_535070 [Dichomitus squalens]
MRKATLRPTVAVRRGPLHYALGIQRNQIVLAQNTCESHAVDLEYDAIALWEYAIDLSTLVSHANPSASGELPSPTFDWGLSPRTTTATACSIS